MSSNGGHDDEGVVESMTHEDGLIEEQAHESLLDQEQQQQHDDDEVVVEEQPHHEWQEEEHDLLEQVDPADHVVDQQPDIDQHPDEDLTLEQHQHDEHHHEEHDEHHHEEQAGEEHVQHDLEHDEHEQLPTEALPDGTSAEDITNAAHLSLLELQAAVNGTNLFQQLPQADAVVDANGDQGVQQQSWNALPLPPLPQSAYSSNPYALPPPARQGYYDNSHAGSSNGRDAYQYSPNTTDGIPVDGSEYIATGLDESDPNQATSTGSKRAADGEVPVDPDVQAASQAPPPKKKRRPRQMRVDGELPMVKCEHILATGAECGLMFKRPYDLARHKETVHSDIAKKKEWPCGQCGNAFSRKDALLRHCRIRGHASGL